MTSSTDTPAGDLLLKVMPPRVPRDLLTRTQLALDALGLRDTPAVLVHAPAGFGKTSLLAQWRLEHLARGAVVAWVGAQSSDDPAWLAKCLATSVRVASGRPAFGNAILRGGARGVLEGITAWLAEVAQAAIDLVLMVDEADRLSPDAFDAIAYVLRNAPPNLRCIIATRMDVGAGIQDLVDYGQCRVLGPQHLRFSLEETLDLARQRLAAAADVDRIARLHARTEGWPLGIRLALALAPAGADPFGGAASGMLPDRFVESLLGHLAPSDLAFLARVSAVNDIHPSLCAAMLDDAHAPEQLDRLVRETPVFGAAESSGWMRMHALAREALMRRFDDLPVAEREGIHARASDWLAGRGMLEAAARHALACGAEDKALELAERSLYESVTGGRPDLVLEWLTRLPVAELERRPRVMLAAAWSLALGERQEEAGRYVDRLMALPDADGTLRFECALILGAAALFADDPDRFAALHDPWAEPPSTANASMLQMHANRSAIRALIAGEPALARLRNQRGPRNVPAANFLDRWGELIVALSYLREAQPVLVDQLLAPCLAGAESAQGRRSPMATLIAALLATARWELGRPQEAAALLADRIDVLERCGLPELLVLAFATLARIARVTQGEQHALEMLGALDAVGLARGMPRLRVASLAEQARLHARAYRAQSCRDVLARMEQLLAEEGKSRGPLWHRSVTGPHLLTQAYAAIAARDWRGAIGPLVDAETLATEFRLGRDRLELMALRAWVLDRASERSRPMLEEVITLARAAGLVRLLDDAHPDLAAWAGQAEQPVPMSVAEAPAAAAQNATPRAAATAALTPKERQVLELLARNLSNKEVGLALQVGEETVKWHVKNLFAKLDAGTRKQVVNRARILGLLA